MWVLIGLNGVADPDTYEVLGPFSSPEEADRYMREVYNGVPLAIKEVECVSTVDTKC